MRISRLLLCCVPAAAGLAAPMIVQAQDSDDLELLSGWYVRASGAARFNVKASITPVAPPAGSANYANGFVLPDIGGSTNVTWNWGFDSASQVDTVHGQIDYFGYQNLPQFNQLNVPVSNPLGGGEVVGGYVLGNFRLGKKPARIGIELGYSYFGLSQGINAATPGTGSYLTAAYNYNGIILPVPPYAGTYAGPGPLLNLDPDTATTTTDAAGATVSTFQGSLKTTMHEMRFGPTFEVDLSKKFTVGVGAGYSAIYADSDFSYAEAVAFGNAGVPSPAVVRGSVAEAKWRPGVYAEARLAYRITERLSAFVGGDLHYNNNMTFGDQNYSVKLDLGMTYTAKLGVGFSF